ncbi:hypothetical protein CRG98_048273 [Punica granatum]|uniref:Uncharacterized protein n=1 Tax=Punica granatum TaxID=22663 RepID=A0A2I0HI03_PUNGR|nr:hypothetical protein CRG98_048273 [Punica granatum]
MHCISPLPSFPFFLFLFRYFITAALESFSLDDIQDLEMTEVDGALLRQLLEEFEIDIAGSTKIEYDDVQSQESKDGLSCVEVTEARDSHWEEGIIVHNFGWIDEIAEMNPVVPSAETTGWYPEDMAGLVEFDFNNVNTEEMVYNCLWDDS